MDDLVTVVEGFRKYGRIVVTGPQRSGTQIASKIIADILNWEFVGEQKMCRKGQDHDERYFKWVTNPIRQSTVLQCPRISHACHLTPKPTLVVFMMRNIAEILESDQHRIKHHTRLSPRKRKILSCISVFTTKRQQYSKLFYDRKEIAVTDTPQVVYDVWNNIQKKEDFNWYELEYKLLEQHEYWLPLEIRRTKFKTGTQKHLEHDLLS